VRHVAEQVGDSAPVALLAMDGRLCYTRWSKVAEVLTGIPARRVVGRSLYEVFPEAPGSPAEQQYFEVLRTGQPVTIRTVLDGVKFELTACPSGEGLTVFARSLPQPASHDASMKEKRTGP